MARAVVYEAPAQKQKLTHNNKLIGCTETSFAVLVGDVTLGGCVITELDARRLSGEWPPDPDSPGLNQRQLATIAKKLHVQYANMSGESWAKLVDAVSLGSRRCVVQLTGTPSIPGANVPHAVLLEQVKDGKGRIMNPFDGKRSWVPMSVLKKGMEQLARKEGVFPGLFWGQSKTVPKRAVG